MTHLRLPCIRDATTSTLIAILTVDRLRAKEKEPWAAQLPAQLPAHILRSSARSGRSEYQKRRRRERRCGKLRPPGGARLVISSAGSERRPDSRRRSWPSAPS